jgi:hypothetical protein
VTKFVNEAPDEPVLISYGLAAPKAPAKDAPPSPRLKVTIGLKTDTDKERVYEFGNPSPDPNFVYARQAGKPAVFTVPRLVYDKFAAPDLRDRHLFRFDVAQVTGLELKGWGKAGKVTELHVVKNKDGEWVTQSPPTPAGFALDPAKVTAFLNTLSRTPVKSYLPGPTTLEQGFSDEKEYLLITVRIKDHPGIAMNLGGPTPDKQAYYGWTSILPQTAPAYTLPAEPFRKYKDGPQAFAR